MTEQEWLSCDDPHRLYEFLRDATTPFKTRWQGWVDVRRFQVSERKWRLFLCACCRRIMPLLPTEESRRLVDEAERYADGRIGEGVLNEAIKASVTSCAVRDLCADSVRRPWYYRDAINAIGRFHRPEGGGREATLRAAAEAWSWSVELRECGRSQRAPNDLERFRNAVLQAEYTRQAMLFRDVMGNPFQTPSFDPQWRSWTGGTAVRIAQAIYDERRFDNLPVLADALQEAGCDDAAILSHCRDGGEHTRGCWLVDLLIGKA